MPTFNITKNGTDYEVDADDEKSANEKLNNHLDKAKGPMGRLSVDPKHLMALARGIPGVGQLIPKTDLEQNHPNFEKGLNVTGGLMSMGAPTVGASKLAAAKFGPGILPEMGAQTGLGLGINTVDKIAEKGSDFNERDLKNSAIMSVLQGIGGPLLGKIISPTFNSNRYTIEQLAKLPEQALERNLTHTAAKEATKEAVKTALEHPITGAALGALGGHLAMGNPLLGAGMGLAAKPIIQGVSHVMSNKMMHDPSHQAILNILAQQKGMEANR